MSRTLTRRRFLAAAAAFGASAAWASPRAARSRTKWTERRELFPEGVASGDPGPDSVILWTRVKAPSNARAVPLEVEVAEDEAFTRVVASSRARALAEADHTCRVLVGGLRPSREYWYRFTDSSGGGSRVGRTLTAPAPDDPRPVRFAFVSCQNPCEGALHAWRRMIYEDERATPAERLLFVLHLGDFIYEVVDYPEDTPGGMRYDRKLRDLIRFPKGEKVPPGFHVPVDVEDYRTVYRAYLHDPDLQDARARWPFVNMWDNHEFSWQGWQSLQVFGGKTRPAQTKKVAANQAWFEYQPARVVQKGSSLERFEGPRVADVGVTRFDGHGLGTEPGNLAAIGSLRGYRALTFGRHVELLITDQHSYRSELPSARAEADPLGSDDFPDFVPEDAMRILDSGRAYAGGHPPEAIPSAGAPVRNFRKDEPPQTILGAEQKAWFLGRLRASRATWKIWGNSEGTLDARVDPGKLPEGVGKRWPVDGYAVFGGGGDYGTSFAERAEIYDTVRDAHATGFLTVSGDRHSFWAGLAAKDLPPAPFQPVGAAFITGSISAPGLVEAFEHRFPKEHPLRALYLAEVGGRVQPAINLLMHHGVATCLEYQKTGDLEAARRLANPELAPHLSFLDWGGHGYAVLRVDAEAAECEFVCIPRPLERSPAPDGGPLRYRVVHRVALWKDGERPVLARRVVEGDPGTSL
jgi:alkaline phosphatase D